MGAIITDLNQRERTRHAETLEGLAKSAKSLAGALRDGDDSTAVLHLITTSLSYQVINELAEVFKAAMHVDIPDHARQTG